MKVRYSDAMSKATVDAIAILKDFGFKHVHIYLDPDLAFDMVVMGYFHDKMYKSIINLTDMVNTPYGISINPDTLQIAINDLCSQVTGSSPDRLPSPTIEPEPTKSPPDLSAILLIAAQAAIAFLPSIKEWFNKDDEA